LQQNCHEFIAYESLISDRPARQRVPKEQKDQKGQKDQKDQKDQKEAKDQKETKGQKEPKSQKPERRRAKTLDIAQAVPLVERTLQVLERRGVQPQLGLMKSTMLQLDSRFSEKTFGSSSFSDFVEKLREGGYVNISGKGGEATIGSQSSPGPEHAAIEPDDALPFLRDVLETHRLDIEEGCLADDLTAWVSEEAPDFDWNDYGFQEFVELLNFAQDKGVVRIEPDEEEGLRVFLGSEFYPPALPEVVEEPKPARKRTSRKRTSSRQSTRRPRETPAK
ncbi:MAG: hypothetical protein GY953_06500, partial [bacterium]|nr:hypothetical protein [bacterium]